MKKVIFMAAIIAAAIVNVIMMSNDKSDLSTLQMANIEALACGEYNYSPFPMFIYYRNDCLGNHGDCHALN